MRRSSRSATVSVLFVVLVGLYATVSVSAQDGGSISGTVKDQSGGVMPGVSVTATNVALKSVQTGITDARGFYSLPRVPVGRYDIDGE